MTRLLVTVVATICLASTVSASVTPRKTPPVFDRDAPDVNVRLPAGSLVQVFPVVTQNDPRWFPDPEKFDPNRFAPGKTEHLPQFAYFPFGGGPRVCIGNSLAMMMMTLAAAAVARRFRLRLAPGQGPVERQLIMSLRPKGEVRMVAEKRQCAAVGASA